MEALAKVPGEKLDAPPPGIGLWCVTELSTGSKCEAVGHTAYEAWTQSDFRVLAYSDVLVKIMPNA